MTVDLTANQPGLIQAVEGFLGSMVNKKVEASFNNMKIEFSLNRTGDGKRPPKPIVQIMPTLETMQSFIKSNFQGLSKDKQAWALRIPFCESGYYPFATNKDSSATGLYQFMPRTFFANAERCGLKNPDIWNWRHQVIVAACMIKNNQEGQWECH